MPKKEDQLQLPTITFNLTIDQSYKVIMGVYARSEDWKENGEENLSQDYIDLRDELLSQFQAQVGK